MKTLHIGNIANNAYLNAKILNERGVPSDVLCLDYYHVMGLPEWEDADFKGNHNDDFYPDLSKVDLNGFKRPSWFIQGGKLDAIKYLIAKNEKSFFKSQYYEIKLKISNLLNEHSNKKYKLFLSKFKSLFVKLNSLFSKFSRLRRLYKYPLLAIIGLIFLPLTIFFILYKLTEKVKLIELRENRNFFQKRIDLIKQNIMLNFKDRAELFDFEVLYNYEKEVYYWRKLFKYYDKVYAYGIDGIYPLLADKEYYAFEHGTLRKMPFDNDHNGIRAFLSYKFAKGVFITNADNIIAAKKLGLENYTFIPHPVNEEPIAKIGTDNNNLKLKEKYNCDFLVYHPARQHWDKQSRDLNYEKGNDIFIEGFARFVKEINPNAKAILSEWGMMLDESKKLINELGIEENIIWSKPVHNFQMTKIIQSVDIVADQFFLGSFGDIMPKACLSKKPTIMYLNEELHKWCFDDMPPVFNTRNSLEVYESLKSVYLNPTGLKEQGEKSLQWYLKYHSNEINYEKLLQL